MITINWQTDAGIVAAQLVTNVRADIEEGLLEEKYPEYRVYKEQTKRYIPFII